MAKQNKEITVPSKPLPESKQQVPTQDINQMIEEIVAESNIEVTPGVDTLDESGHKKTAGRPIDPKSPRQIRLAEQAVKQLLGLSRRGRPVEPGSERQQRLTEMEERKIANGGVLTPGRPPMSEEDKVKAKKEREKRFMAQKQAIAEKAKQKLIAAGLLDEDGHPIVKG